MADLRVNFAGIESPNPFWLASGPPTNTYGQVAKAFDNGWGGAVWKTVGDPIINVFSRYGSLDLGKTRMVGFNNIELISDRPIEDNFREIAEVKRKYPRHAVIASLMVESKREKWHEMVKRAIDAGSDGLELNFGCPHGMSERGMGSAVGQVPDYACEIVGWVKEASTIPVIVKLTPNVTDVTYVARAARKGGGDAISLINTINSVMGVDLDTMIPLPNVGGKSSHGGYCGPAVKPIALHMVSAVAGDPQVGLPISGIGGIHSWRDAAEFIALGAGTVQVCTAAMHYGFRIVEDMIDGLSNWMDDKGYRTIEDFRGVSVPKVSKWEDLDLNYHLVAHIDQDKCIKCELCWTACEDGAHQAIRRYARQNGNPVVEIVDEACVGCNLCSEVCPVQGCITMREVENGYPPVTWKQFSAGQGELAPRSEHFHTVGTGHSALGTRPDAAESRMPSAESR